MANLKITGKVVSKPVLEYNPVHNTPDQRARKVALQSGTAEWSLTVRVDYNMVLVVVL